MNLEQSNERDRAELVRCPEDYCRAEPGQTCINPHGHKLVNIPAHHRRILAATATETP